MTKPDPADLPRSMEGEGLKILPFYTEAGYFTEANVIKVTDGTRTALYVPYQVCEEEADHGPGGEDRTGTPGVGGDE